MKARVSHSAKVQKYEQSKISLQFFEMWYLEHYGKRIKNPAWVSKVWPIQPISAKKGGMAVPW